MQLGENKHRHVLQSGHSSLFYLSKCCSVSLQTKEFVERAPQATIGFKIGHLKQLDDKFWSKRSSWCTGWLYHNGGKLGKIGFTAVKCEVWQKKASLPNTDMWRQNFRIDWWWVKCKPSDPELGFQGRNVSLRFFSSLIWDQGLFTSQLLNILDDWVMSYLPFSVSNPNGNVERDQPF